MTMITPSYLGETIEYSSLHACRSTLEDPTQTSAALEMKWARRVRGDSPIVQVERVFDEDGEPLGYRHLTGVGVLDQQKRAVFQCLPEEFTTAEAKAVRREHHLGDGNDPTNKFLAECKQLRIVEKLGKGRWRKTAA